MALAHRHRIDPEASMARFYIVDVAPTLFGEVSVLRTWAESERMAAQASRRAKQQMMRRRQRPEHFARRWDAGTCRAKVASS